MTRVKQCTLALAVTAALGLSMPLFAQERAGQTGAGAEAQKSAEAANAAAREARKASAEAKRAAREAAKTGSGDAHAAHHASVTAEAAKNEAVVASQQTAGASSQAISGTQREQAALEARAGARAADRARDRAVVAGAVAQDAATPVPPPEPASVAVPASPNASDNARIATSAPGAMAAHRHMTGAGRFHLDTTVLDADKDGVLTQAEVAGNISLSTDFARIDTNSDGRLASDELRAWINAGGLAKNARPLGDLLSGTGLSADARFDMLDLDDDGALSAKEAGMHQGLRASFRTLDRNRDGRLSSSEFSAWTEAGNR